MANVSDKLKGRVPVRAPQTHKLTKIGAVVSEYDGDRIAQWTFYSDEKGVHYTRIQRWGQDDLWFAYPRRSVLRG